MLTSLELPPLCSMAVLCGKGSCWQCQNKLCHKLCKACPRSLPPFFKDLRPQHEMINITHLHFTSTNYIFKRLFIFKRTSDQVLSSSLPQKKEQQTQQKSSLFTWQISKTNTRSAPVILSCFLEHSSFGETTLQNFSLISCTSSEAQYSTSVKCTPILTGTCMFSQSSCPSQHQKSCPIPPAAALATKQRN